LNELENLSVELERGHGEKIGLNDMLAASAAQILFIALAGMVVEVLNLQLNSSRSRNYKDEKLAFEAAVMCLWATTPGGSKTQGTKGRLQAVRHDPAGPRNRITAWSRAIVPRLELFAALPIR
jgi:hypothetical protein